eukprot:1662667-Prymnesium_polylepis.1
MVASEGRGFQPEVATFWKRAVRPPAFGQFHLPSSADATRVRRSGQGWVSSTQWQLQRGHAKMGGTCRGMRQWVGRGRNPSVQ